MKRNQEFKASLSYVRCCLNNNTKGKRFKSYQNIQVITARANLTGTTAAWRTCSLAIGSATERILPYRMQVIYNWKWHLVRVLLEHEFWNVSYILKPRELKLKFHAVSLLRYWLNKTVKIKNRKTNKEKNTISQRQGKVQYATLGENICLDTQARKVWLYGSVSFPARWSRLTFGGGGITKILHYERKARLQLLSWSRFKARMF